MKGSDANMPSFPALRDSRYPVHKIADQLEPYLRCLVERVHPEKVILFGSQACGEPTEHSDVDLLVIHREQKAMLQGNLEVRRAFREAASEPLSFSIISLTAQDLREKLSKHEPLFEDIFRSGVELYAA